MQRLEASDAVRPHHYSGRTAGVKGLKADKKMPRNIYSQPFIKIRIVSKGVL